jgi:hypothetical protein
MANQASLSILAAQLGIMGKTGTAKCCIKHVARTPQISDNIDCAAEMAE